MVLSLFHLNSFCSLERDRTSVSAYLWTVLSTRPMVFIAAVSAFVASHFSAVVWSGLSSWLSCSVNTDWLLVFASSSCFGFDVSFLSDLSSLLWTDNNVPFLRQLWLVCDLILRWCPHMVCCCWCLLFDVMELRCSSSACRFWLSCYFWYLFATKLFVEMLCVGGVRWWSQTRLLRRIQLVADRCLFLPKPHEQVSSALLRPTTEFRSPITNSSVLNLFVSWMICSSWWKKGK